MAKDRPLVGVSKACEGACGLLKDLSEYETRTHASGEVGYHNRCRECRNAERRESAKAWYERNRDYQIAQSTNNKAPKRGRPEKAPQERRVPLSTTISPAAWLKLQRISKGNLGEAATKVILAYPEDES